LNRPFARSTNLAPGLALGHVREKTVTADRVITNGEVVSFFNSDVLADRLLQRLTLFEDAVFHFPTQLMIDFKVLHLQLHTTLLLCVDQLRQHCLAIARFEILLALSDTLVRHALMKLTVWARVVVQRVGDIEFVRGYRDLILLILLVCLL